MKVLITDDDVTMQEILTSFFKSRGDSVVVCLDVATLIREVKDCDLIVADYDTYIPFSMIEKLDKPTILATGSTMQNYPFTLAKPYSFSDLRSMISIVLNAHGQLAV